MTAPDDVTAQWRLHLQPLNWKEVDKGCCDAFRFLLFDGFFLNADLREYFLVPPARRSNGMLTRFVVLGGQDKDSQPRNPKP